MGKKGDKETNQAVTATESLVAKIQSIEGIVSKKMFGGYGIFHEGKMFGIVDSKGLPFLKINDDIVSDFVDHGALQHSRMPYYSIPNEVLTNDSLLIEWASRSIEISK